MNRFEITGRLVKNPETRFTKEGKGITTFTLAVNNGKDDTSFIKVTTFNGTGDIVQKYTHKGDLVLVEGTIKNNNYEKEGIKHYEHIFIGNKVEFLTSYTNNTKKEEQAEKGTENALSDEAFIEFGNSIEINNDEIAF